MQKKLVFEDFNDYWHYARYLSKAQRKIIFGSLPHEQKKILDNSYLEHGWSDLFYRNEVHEKIDELREEYGFDILKIKAQALTGKSVYVPTRFWKLVEEKMNQYHPDVVRFAIDGLRAYPCDNNENVCLIVHNKYDTSE